MSINSLRRYNQRKYDTRKAKGLCVLCGNYPAMDGITSCFNCLKKATERNRSQNPHSNYRNLAKYDNNEKEIYWAMKWDFEHNQLHQDKIKYFKELEAKHDNKTR